MATMLSDPHQSEGVVLLDSWDSQQALYRPGREAGFALLVDIVEQALPDQGSGLVVELGCGCGSVLRRIRQRLSRSQVIGADRDPVMLAIARAVLGDDENCRLLDADLLELPGVAELKGTRPNVVVATTTLHWLADPDLRSVYRWVAEHLRPGGVFVNLDWMPLAHSPAVSTMAEQLEHCHSQRQRDLGAQDWHGWWQTAEHQEWLGPHFEQRRSRSFDRSAEFTPDAEWHLQALTEAGFVEVDVAWRHLNSAMVVAVR